MRGIPPSNYAPVFPSVESATAALFASFILFHPNTLLLLPLGVGYCKPVGNCLENMNRFLGAVSQLLGLSSCISSFLGLRVCCFVKKYKGQRV